MLVTMKALTGCFLSKVWFGAGPSYSLWGCRVLAVLDLGLGITFAPRIVDNRIGHCTTNHRTKPSPHP